MGTGASQDIKTAYNPPWEVATMNDVFIEATPHTSEREKVKGLIISLSAKYGVKEECFSRIVECESNYKNVPNAKYGGDYGFGPAQIIPGTARYCEEKLGREIDRKNIEDNLECAAYLLSESPEGWKHWGTEDSRMENGERWGSYHCIRDECVP